MIPASQATTESTNNRDYLITSFISSGGSIIDECIKTQVALGFKMVTLNWLDIFNSSDIDGEIKKPDLPESVVSAVQTQLVNDYTNAGYTVVWPLYGVLCIMWP
jgi:hypothetical protein